jgi:general secretion pathway protein G
MERREENAAVLAMRAGFTLIEILVAVAIIGILGTIATINVTSFLEKSRVTAAKEAVGNIKGAVVNDQIHTKKLPSDLRALVTASGDEEPILEGGEGALEDPWGNEYKFERTGKKFAVISAGPDGEFGTDDDIRSDKIASAGKNN